MSIVIISERIRLTVCIRVSGCDYSAGNNRDTPFRAGLINQIQAGRETSPWYQPVDPGLSFVLENRPLWPVYLPGMIPGLDSEFLTALKRPLTNYRGMTGIFSHLSL